MFACAHTHREKSKVGKADLAKKENQRNKHKHN